MTRKADPRATRLPVPAGQLPTFTPVPRKCARHDGWSEERQLAFIEALADTGSVAAACKVINMSQRGAYHLRRQPGAEEFRAAWEQALDLGVQRIEDVAMDRALNGVDEPLYSYGKLIGTRKRYNDRLLMFMLRNRAPDRFAQGKANLKGLNAIGKMEKRRLKKKWRKQWEDERASVSPAEVRARIDRKVEGLRAEVEAQRKREWEQLSAETREAWERFETLRDRDLDALKADEEMRRRLERKPRVLKNATPPPKKEPPAPKEPKTVHRLKDDGWD